MAASLVYILDFLNNLHRKPMDETFSTCLCLGKFELFLSHQTLDVQPEIAKSIKLCYFYKSCKIYSNLQLKAFYKIQS